MQLLTQLLSDDVGVLSLITIVVTAAVVGVCIVMFIRKSKKPDAK
jgi:hypothetical protein